MEYYALEYTTRTALRITQSNTAQTNIQNAAERRGEGKPSRPRAFLAYDDGRTPLERRKPEVQGDIARPRGQLKLIEPWDIRGGPYEQAFLAYRHAQMIMEAEPPRILDTWA